MKWEMAEQQLFDMLLSSSALKFQSPKPFRFSADGPEGDQKLGVGLPKCGRPQEADLRFTS
jgi:hypothetical protein